MELCFEQLISRALVSSLSGVAIFGVIFGAAAPAPAAEAKRVEIIAHRGASHDAPENTIAAFELAWGQGADGIEGDFYLTADGHIVCIHDRTTKRTTGGEVDLDVQKTTLAELRQLDVGRWKGEQFAGQRIPTLQEVLALVKPGKKSYLETKSGPEIVEPMRRIIANSSLPPEQIVVIAYNADTVAETRRLLPQLKVYWLTSYRHNDETGVWTPTLDQVLATLDQSNAHGLNTNANLNIVHEAFVAALREKGHEFHAWTINDGELARRFRDLGVDSITTDRPGWLREQLNMEKP